MNNLLQKIQEIQLSNYGITTRKIHLKNIDIYLFFIIEIVSRKMLNESIIKSILSIKNNENLSIDYLVNEIICVDDITIYEDFDALLDYILNGNTVIVTSIENKFIVINTKKIEKRAISSPEIESVLKGPKDCFCENFESNISLIRYRIKDSSLRINMLLALGLIL